MAGMMIVSQNGKVAVNMENVLAMEVQGKYIHAHPANGWNPVTIAAYENHEDAGRSFDILLDRISEKTEVISV